MINFQVRSEIQMRHHEEEEMKLIEKKRERERARREVVEEDVQFKSTMGEFRAARSIHLSHRHLDLYLHVWSPVWYSQNVFFLFHPAKNLYRTLFLSKAPERNELFMPGRMVRDF